MGKPLVDVGLWFRSSRTRDSGRTVGHCEAVWLGWRRRVFVRVTLDVHYRFLRFKLAFEAGRGTTIYSLRSGTSSMTLDLKYRHLVYVSSQHFPFVLARFPLMQSDAPLCILVNISVEPVP